MKRPVQCQWLLGLIFLALTACGEKNEARGVVTSMTPRVNSVENSPVTDVAVAGGSAPSSRRLQILPERPTAQDSLIAVYQGEGRKVVFRWERDDVWIEGEERGRLAATYLKKGATVTVKVESDGSLHSDSVIIGNIPPTVNVVTITNPAIHRGVDIELVATGEDADNDSVTFRYQWFRNGSQISGVYGPKLAGDQFRRGDQISFTVIPFDGNDEGEPYLGSPVVIPNAPPIFVTTPPLNFLSERYFYQTRAVDPDGDKILYSLDNPPQGMTIDRRTGLLDWPLDGVPAGLYRVNIVVEDTEGQKNFQEYALTMERR